MLLRGPDRYPRRAAPWTPFQTIFVFEPREAGCVVLCSSRVFFRCSCICAPRSLVLSPGPLRRGNSAVASPARRIQSRRRCDKHARSAMKRCTQRSTQGSATTTGAVRSWKRERAEHSSRAQEPHCELALPNRLVTRCSPRTHSASANSHSRSQHTHTHLQNVRSQFARCDWTTSVQAPRKALLSER